MVEKKVLVTGANGFIGRNLCTFLKEKGCFVRCVVRNNLRDVSGVDEYIQVGDINELTDWQQALFGVDTIIHLAARVHIMNDPAVNPMEAFRKVNVLGTERLARMAVKAGVKRFIFLSSIGVNGEFTEKGSFTEDDIPNPVGAYVVSKWEAEQSLQKVTENRMKVVILRAPLVYGSDAPGNFGRLMHLIKAHMPLPFGRIKNLRSFIYLGNLVDAIFTCIQHPKAAGETFLVSDGQDVSTPDLIKMIACAMNKKVVLFSLHPSILKALCRILGKSEEFEKFTVTLLVDSSKIKNLLGWKPPFTLEEGIRETVRGIEIASALRASQ